jgi:hypothetical protein
MVKDLSCIESCSNKEMFVFVWFASHQHCKRPHGDFSAFLEVLYWWESHQHRKGHTATSQMYRWKKPAGAPTCNDEIIIRYSTKCGPVALIQNVLG